MSARSQSQTEGLFLAARGGSNSSLGRLLSLYSNYLKLLVTMQLDARLRTRVSASDIVQESFYEAHRDFGQFRGQTAPEFVAWLKQIVANNIHRMVEQHMLAEKRDVRREMSLQEIGERLEQSTVQFAALFADAAESPSRCASQREDEVLLADALAALPSDYRDVIVLRHIEGLPFEEVARRTNRSAGAARMMWLRALKKLRELVSASM